MSPDIALLFWGLVLFESKHFLCDFVLQTSYQAVNKGTYGHPGGLIHAGLHFLGSIPAILLLTRSPLLIGALLFGELLVHYHADWLKEQINRARGLGYEHMLFWVVFGADQFVHQMTYVIALAVIVRFGA
jgi:hypothetical protein